MITNVQYAHDVQDKYPEGMLVDTETPTDGTEKMNNASDLTEALTHIKILDKQKEGKIGGETRT